MTLSLPPPVADDVRAAAAVDDIVPRAAGDDVDPDEPVIEAPADEAGRIDVLEVADDAGQVADGLVGIGPD